MKHRGITSLSSPALGSVAAVGRYHAKLLYTAAYPPSEELANHAHRELLRVAEHVARRTQANPDAFENSGIAGSTVCSVFSLELNKWLIQRFGTDVWLYSEGMDQQAIVDTLVHVFDPVEYEMLHAGRTEWEYWSENMTGQGADPHLINQWLVRMADRLPGSSAIKEYIFSRFSLFSVWQSPLTGMSLTTGRAPRCARYVHTNGLQREVDLQQRLTAKPPIEIKLKPSERQDVIDLSRGVLAHLTRETDPSTYANASEVSYYDLGRGTTIALLPMVADMKMALQSYIGFMVFKNGIACAYGGAWLLFGESGFGVNILPPFRGGESALIVSDLLRLYHHVYHVSSFTVDPYQIGFGNPDGIASGAFWFYYRLGFRPTQRALAALAKQEWALIATDPTYRSGSEVLEELSNSTLRWTVRGSRGLHPITADALGDAVTRWVNTHYQGDRQLARTAAIEQMSKVSGKSVSTKDSVCRVAVLLAACGYLNTVGKAELQRFIRHYALKSHHEGEYVRGSQTFTHLFDRLVQTTKRR